MVFVFLYPEFPSKSNLHFNINIRIYFTNSYGKMPTLSVCSNMPDQPGNGKD